MLRAISNFNEALNIDPDNEEAKIALASVLIDKNHVRDLNTALNILGKIKNKSGRVQQLTSKAERWTGDSKFDPNFDYENIQLIPLGVLREERTKCRALIQTLKKRKKNDDLTKVLEHMYRVAVLHDVSTYVMLYCGYSIDPKTDRAWDTKLHSITKNINEYSYQHNGKLIESNNCFFSNRDYLAFEMIFGKSEEIFNPILLIKEQLN